MIYNILKENRYIFPFLTVKNKLAKNKSITINKEIIINSFGNLFEQLISEEHRKIFNFELIIENIKSNKMAGLSQLEYLSFYLLGQNYDINKHFIHEIISKNTYFIKGDKLLTDFNSIPSTFNNENKIYSFDNTYSPFYIFSFEKTYIVFIQSGLSKEQQKIIYLFLKQEYLFNKPYDNLHYISFNFSNLWTQELFNYISETMVLEDTRYISAYEDELPNPSNFDKNTPNFKKLM